MADNLQPVMKYSIAPCQGIAIYVGKIQKAKAKVKQGADFSTGMTSIL